ncbi:MAG: hypothetical protein HKN23_07505 [Verrucomicrobiales bacterium]|nr:hypothetical protein [Verrucomicrobiales bacterium]
MSTIAQSPVSPAAAAKTLPDTSLPLNQTGLAIEILEAETQKTIGMEPVHEADFSEAIHENWRENHLRKGLIKASPDDLPIEAILIADKENPARCLGYALTMPGPDGKTAHSVFSVYSLDFVARRGIQRLRQNGKIEKDTATFYRLAYQPGLLPAAEKPANQTGMTVVRQKPELHYLRVPLAPLLDRATTDPLPLGLSGEEKAFPVFFTEKALQQAEECSRKGAVDNPNFESGGVLAGSLASCPDTGEFFAIVHAVFPATDTEETLVSLTFSGKSWARIQSIVQARQKIQPAFRLLGNCHGHNFVPNDGQTCEACPTREHCDSHNLFCSADDREWTRAVFGKNPFQLCQIFGLTARGDHARGLFGLHDGRLNLREFHIMPDFNPADYKNDSTGSVR